MAVTRSTPEAIAARAHTLYDREIRPRVEAGNRGKYLVLNVETGDFEMDEDDLAASKRARARFPDATLFTLRVGFPAAYRLGGRGKAGGVPR